MPKTTEDTTPDENLVQSRSAIGSCLLQIRQERGLTQHEFAKQIGIHASKLGMMEIGQHRLQSKDAQKICSHLTVHETLLLFEAWTGKSNAPDYVTDEDLRPLLLNLGLAAHPISMTALSRLLDIQKHFKTALGSKTINALLKELAHEET